MAHKNRENQKFALEMNIRLRINKTQPKSATVRKWIVALLVPVIVKIAIHFFRLG